MSSEVSCSFADRIAIVLVEPQSPGNIGMVCRAMKNFGLKDLRLVNPCQVLHPEAQKFAVSAKELLGSARVFGSLKEALADTELTIATTRRHGKYRQEILTPESVAERLKTHLGGNRGAIVFGREDSGLTTEEVALCRWHATIPTGDEYGSLNLAQAVLIFCYELFTGLTGAEFPDTRTLASTEESESMFDELEAVLLKIGFLNPQNPAHIMRTLRRIFARAEMDSREVAILHGMVTQIDWAANHFEGKKKL